MHLGCVPKDQMKQTKHLHSSWVNVRSFLCPTAFYTTVIFIRNIWCTWSSYNCKAVKRLIRTVQYMYLYVFVMVMWDYIVICQTIPGFKLASSSDLFRFIIHSVIEINITDDCLSKILIVLMFCESTNSSSLQSWLLGLHNYLEIRLCGISKLEELLLFYKGYYFINVSQNSIWLHFVAL